MKIVTKNVYADGTSLKGYIDVSYENIVKVFGEPTYESHPGEDKVTCEWVFEIDGVVGTIYNWKSLRNHIREYNWHIGGRDKRILDLIQAAMYDANVIDFSL